LTAVDILHSGVCLTNAYAWPQVQRGSETVIRSLAAWLRQTGVDAEIVAGSDAPSSSRLDGVPVVLVRARSHTGVHRDLDPELTLVPAMARYLHRRRPAVVHSFLYGDAAAARLAGRPYAVSYGGIALRSSFEHRPLKYRLFRFASAGARAVVCPSAAAAAHLSAEFGFKARVIPNGLDVGHYSPTSPHQAGMVLCTATPDDPRKRVSVLVDAFGLLASDRPDAELVLAGRASDEHRAELLDRVPDHIRARVRFVGDVDAEELRALYAQAAITCLPSINEAFGMVLVESLASGAPVVGADHGAITEIIGGDVGALFVPDDVQACRRALAETLERADDQDLRQRCVARAAAYDWSVVGPRLVRLYEEIA